MSDSKNQDNLSIVAKNIALFSTNFYKTVTENEKSNFICSPISASIALAMTAFGARNNTEKEIRSALHLSEDDEVNKLGYQHLIDTFNAVKNVQLDIANKLFIANDIKIHCPFVSITKDFFRSELQLVDFEQCETARKIINDWCEEKTNNRIKDILQPGDIKPITRLAIVNAIYFKGNWKNQFDATRTKLEPFNIDRETRIYVLMMKQKASYNFGHLTKLDATYVELPYKSNNEEDAMSMFIILPNKIDGLKTIEKNLHEINFQQLHAHGYAQKIILNLPKFKIESTIQLGSTLATMGMIDMFDIEKADFSGISNEFLYVDKVIQKAFIEVNEEGSEAAAVTVVLLAGRCARRPVPEIIVNRPFFCAIVATKTGTQLFNARVVDPSHGSLELDNKTCYDGSTNSLI